MQIQWIRVSWIPEAASALEPSRRRLRCLQRGGDSPAEAAAATTTAATAAAAAAAADSRGRVRVCVGSLRGDRCGAFWVSPEAQLDESCSNG